MTEKERSALDQYREAVASGEALHNAWRSHASRRPGGPPVTREAWSSCLEWLAKLARRSDAFAQVVAHIGLPPLYQTDGEAAAHVYREAFDALRVPYDDVVRRAGPEPGRYSDCLREWTLAERILILAFLQRATHRLDCTAWGYGWGIEALAREEHVALPPWERD